MQVEQTGAAVIDELNLFSEEQLNIVPFEGSWTGGQVGEHLLKSAGVVEAIYGRTAPTTESASRRKNTHAPDLP